MPDHLLLGVPTAVDGKRRHGGPTEARLVDRAQQATTIAGILAGLESGGRSLFPIEPETRSDVEEMEELGTVVLKFTTRGAPKKGPFSKLKMTPLGENTDNEYYVLSSAESRTLFAELLGRYGTSGTGDHLDPKAWLEMLDQLVGVELYGASDRLDPSLVIPADGEVLPVEVVLWPTSSLSDRSAKPAAANRLAELESMVRTASAADQRIRVVAKDERPDTLLLRVEASSELISDFSEHPYIQTLRGPLVTPMGSTVDLPDVGQASDPAPPDGPLIGVVDDLVVSANPWMRDVVTVRETFPVGTTLGGWTDHGTLVASIAAYGDLEGFARGAFPGTPFPIAAARVAEASAAGSPVVVGNTVQQFESALTWLSSVGAKIVVIALGYDTADSGPLPSDLTVTIDRMARELGLVVVVSAGNISDPGAAHWADDYPAYLGVSNAGVAAPGTAALALTVGATAHRDQPSDATAVAIARAGHPSPFTRTGPTRGNSDGKTLKPEFAANGGNWGWQTGGSSPVVSDLGLGVLGLSGQNAPLIRASSGTSLAAPAVAHEVAVIAKRYPDAGPNLLRALTALSGPPTREVANHPGRTGILPRLSSAYGEPNASRVLESGGNRAILVHEGTIETGSRLVHTIPIPREFAANDANAQRHFRVTLAFDPPVKRSRRDYVAGRMGFHFVRNMDLDLVLRTYTEQPTLAEVAATPTLERLDLPSGSRRPSMFPGVEAISSNTLIRRDYVANQRWDEDDDDYHIVVYHNHSPWTPTQQAQYKEQDYALAIEIVDLGRPTLDLHALIAARLEARLRERARR